MGIFAKYTVTIKKQAKKVLDELPRKVRKNIDEKIEKLKIDPIAQAEGGPMEGFSSRYKFRQGGWRVIYEVNQEEITVEVIKIGSRGDVYKDGGG